MNRIKRRIANINHALEHLHETVVIGKCIYENALVHNETELAIQSDAMVLSAQTIINYLTEVKLQSAKFPNSDFIDFTKLNDKVIPYKHINITI